MAEAGTNDESGVRVPANRVRLQWIVMLVLCGLLLAVTVFGLPYYVLDLGGRVRHDLHPYFKASGSIGQSAGIAAMALFIFIWLYVLRRKFRFLAFTGSLVKWLDLHVLAGLMVPWLAAIHAGFRFTGLIGLAYIAMFLVCLSGIVGRYLYRNIPRAASGIALSRQQINESRRKLIVRIASTTGIEPGRIEELLVPPGATVENAGSLWNSFVILLTGDFLRWRAVRELRRRWLASGKNRKPLDRRKVALAVRLAKKEIGLSQRLRMLTATERLFRFWHVAHRPFAITALVGVLIHVGVVIALGVTWLY
jgi:hypothetical protein